MRTNVFILVTLFAGCAPALKSARSPALAKPEVKHIEIEPLKVEAVTTPSGRSFNLYDATSLFEQAGTDLENKHFAEAQVGYERLLKEFPESRYVVAAHYNAGLALEGLNDFGGAAAHYRVIVEQHADSKDVLDALFRLGACLAEIGDWSASAEVFTKATARTDLSVGDRVEALARRGLAQYNTKHASEAERSFREALAVFQDNQRSERLESDFYVAMAHYYLGELAHDAFRQAPVRLPQKQLAQDLEAKAQLLLVTQARYVDTARLKNPAWAVVAAYQMAQLYKEFYDAMLGAPTPPELTTAELKEVYFDELRKQIEPLLRKAIHAHELALGVAERFGIDNEWVRKSSDEMQGLRALVNPAERPGVREPAADPRQPSRAPAPVTPTAPPASEYRPRVIL